MVVGDGQFLVAVVCAVCVSSDGGEGGGVSVVWFLVESCRICVQSDFGRLSLCTC